MKLKFLFLFYFIIFLNNNLFSFQDKSINSTFDSIYKKVLHHSKKRQNNKALFYAHQLLIEAKKNKNIKQQAKSYNKLAIYNYRENFNDSAFYYYRKSKELYIQLGDSINIGMNLLNIGIIESDYGSYSASDSTLVESIKYVKGKRDRTMASAYNCLAINAKDRFLYTDAITYYNKALEFSTKKSSKNIYKNNLANVYKELKNYPKSILILENLLKDSITDQKTKARIIDNLAHIKWLNKSKENILKELLLAVSIREKLNDNSGLIASYNHLSDYFRDNNKLQSLFYANKMYEVAKKEKATNGLLESIDIIVSLQKPEKSIKYYKESIHLRDSLQEEETKRQYKFAKIKYNYEEEQKQKQKFKTLATESKLVVEQQRSEKKNIIIIGVLLTFGFIFLIYRRKYQYQKRILQETYDTETRIAKKLHDELGNDIFNTLTKVQNAKIKKAEIINDLDKIYLQTRAISHENDCIETGSDFENYFRNLVAGYNSNTCKIILKDLSVLDLNNLKKEKQVVIYRVFNELFVNMKKHSKASLVVLSCKKTKHNIEMIYADNGIGFNENTIILKNGLKNMETRIKTIKGTINFENKPNKGLKVNIHFKN
ncbi:hypothetical protein [Polaribacter staleyi]|uniref:tetratricopeptide repeat-containing sensor histidine kinase n=1 Tax=Polaribacter staleyi TaxID=2022337 RepID=UPI0031BB3A1B